jgi:hypothetical protein
MLSSRRYPVHGLEDLERDDISAEQRAWERSPEYQVRQQELRDISSATSINQSTTSYQDPFDSNNKTTDLIEVTKSDKHNQGALTAKTLIYTPSVPEYPMTNPDGVLYIISADSLTPVQKAKPWTDVSIY